MGGCARPTDDVGTAPAVRTNKTYSWRMVTTWPPHFPVLGEGADLLATWIDEMSDSRLQIQVYGGGELVPPLESFDAVSTGTAEMGHGASYYWAGKAPASQFFAAVPDVEGDRLGVVGRSKTRARRRRHSGRPHHPVAAIPLPGVR